MKKGFKLTQAVEVTEALIEYRDNYNDRGKYLGFENLNDLYTMQLGTCTDWTGFPRSGKTQVLMELLLNTSLYYGWKHLVYFPDVGSNVEIIADLLHKKTAKCFNPKYKNVISDKDIYRETEWLLEHFKVLTKADVKAKLTPFEFYDMAASMKDEIQTASIDSWKDMSHPYNEYGGYAMYLEAVLPYRNQTAEDNNLHIHTVIHPKLTEKENGTRKAPTPYDLKGGSEWFNSGKCMVTVHRESTETTCADISVHKVKPRSCGNVGFCSLEFDVEKLVYFTTEQTVNGNVKKYATEKSKPANVESIKPPTPMKPNKDFDINNRIEPQGKVEDWEEPGLDLWQ
jgi:hypothetical protein